MLYNSAFILRMSPTEQVLVNLLPNKPDFPVTYPYVIRDGDNVLSLANKLFGDTRLWFLIPEANPQLDIFNLIVGSQILVPHV